MTAYVSERPVETQRPVDGDRPVERVLWGRVAALGLIVVLAFLLGRATVSRGVPRSELEEAQGAVIQLTEENAGLQRQLASVTSRTQTGVPVPPAVVPDQPAPAAGTEADSDDRSGPTASSDEDAGAASEDAAAGATAPAPGRGAPPQIGEERSYRVRTGDSLAAIALKMYGDEQSWRLIADANQLAANQLTVGQVLRIPPTP